MSNRYYGAAHAPGIILAFEWYYTITRRIMRILCVWRSRTTVTTLICIVVSPETRLTVDPRHRRRERIIYIVNESRRNCARFLFAGSPRTPHRVRMDEVERPYQRPFIILHVYTVGRRTSPVRAYIIIILYRISDRQRPFSKSVICAGNFFQGAIIVLRKNIQYEYYNIALPVHYDFARGVSRRSNGRNHTRTMLVPEALFGGSQSSPSFARRIITFYFPLIMQTVHILSRLLSLWPPNVIIENPRCTILPRLNYRFFPLHNP